MFLAQLNVYSKMGERLEKAVLPGFRRLLDDYPSANKSEAGGVQTPHLYQLSSNIFGGKWRLTFVRQYLKWNSTFEPFWQHEKILGMYKIPGGEQDSG
jgi:hypothetical protein